MSTTPNMGLVLPVPGTTAGPTYASQEVTAFQTIDSHTHVAGAGVPIPTAGLNINADLTLNGFGLFAANRLTLNSLGSGVTTAGSVFSFNGELTYRDFSGNTVPLTAKGSVAGATGTIAGLASPASATYSSTLNTFSFLQGPSLPGKLAISDITISENGNATANPITLKSPASLAASYTLTLPPALPSTSSLFVVTNTGQANFGVDASHNAKLSVTGGVSTDNGSVYLRNACHPLTVGTTTTTTLVDTNLIGKTIYNISGTVTGSSPTDNLPAPLSHFSSLTVTVRTSDGTIFLTNTSSSETFNVNLFVTYQA